jgi:hypothetical protein
VEPKPTGIKEFLESVAVLRGKDTAALTRWVFCGQKTLD